LRAVIKKFQKELHASITARFFKQNVYAEIEIAPFSGRSNQAICLARREANIEKWIRYEGLATN